VNSNPDPLAVDVLERKIGRNAPPNFLFRPVHTGLFEVVDRPGEERKVTAIVAPVGYGKTVFMALLHERSLSRGERCFWTALDDRDRSVERVLTLVEELVYRRDELALHPTQALFRGDEPIERRIDALVDVLAAQRAGITLFIDNLNSCTDPALGYLLDRLVFATPAAVQFVFSSTTDLPLNLARAKLEGLIRQIGYLELSLSAGEASELLGPQLCRVIGADGVQAVARQTEGWPAAVRMMQIILAGEARPETVLQRFSGSDEDLAALLNRQVLSGFPTEIQEFLLDIAQLRTLNGDLCRQATGNERAEQHLAFLLSRNVFMIPLDRNRTWYRLHGLFREYLLSEAQRTLPAARRQKVLTRGSGWCTRNGYWREAIDYALAGSAFKNAASLLECTAAGFVRDLGDVPQYIAWVEALRLHQRSLGWEVEYWYIWALVLQRRYDYSRQQMQRLERRIERQRERGDELEHLAEFRRRLDITKVCLDIFSDRLADAHDSAARWLEKTGSDDPFDITAARCTQSVFYSSAFLFAAARQAAQAGQMSASQTRGGYAKGWVVAIDALPPILEGDYLLIHPQLTAALANLGASLDPGTGINGTIALLAAHCAVEQGRDDEARQLLAQGLRVTQIHGIVDAVACGLDAAVKLWTGAADDPLSIPHLREIAASYPARASFMLSCFLVRRLVRLGRLGEAQAEAARIGLRLDAPPVPPKPVAAVARSRDAFFAAAIELGLAAGQVRQVEPLIAQEIRLARADGRVARLVELALVETVIAIQDGHPAAARHLTRAVSLAAARGVVRPFNDYGAVIAPLVEDTKPAAWGFALAQERHFFAEVCRRLPISDRSLQEKLVALNIESHLHDPLTKRQIELLGLIDAGLSNQQIADRINVSLTTVKGHLQKLYAKFGVASRSAALARARALKLL